MINSSVSFTGSNEEGEKKKNLNYQHILNFFKKRKEKKRAYLWILIFSTVFAHLIFQQETLMHLHMKQR